VFRVHHARIDSGCELRLQDNGASWGFDSGPIAFAKAQSGGGLRMDLHKRIGVLLA
jgi:hypothetical protein